MADIDKALPNEVRKEFELPGEEEIQEQVLEELQEDLEMLDEAIWETIMKVDEIYVDDFHLSSAISRIASRLEDAREQNQMLLSEVLMELEQYEPDRDLFNWRDE